MSHGTETVGGNSLTREEKKTLDNLLKHPKAKEMADEVAKKNKKNDE